MRIIAGKWRGHRIAAPESNRTRPILDRAKTVLFDMLGHRLATPGTLPPVAVLDLFAGSGALGLEALSRGARYCLLVEQHRSTAELLRRNLDTLRIVNEAEVVQADATQCRIKPPPPETAVDHPDAAPPRYELVFMDPPYRMMVGNRPDPAIGRLLTTLADSPLVASHALIVTRHEGKHAAPDLAPLAELEQREVGSMLFRFLRRPEAVDRGLDRTGAHEATFDVDATRSVDDRS
jgi:16S rRNA (guanine966-N2)-methyltransferase